MILNMRKNIKIIVIFLIIILIVVLAISINFIKMLNQKNIEQSNEIDNNMEKISTNVLTEENENMIIIGIKENKNENKNEIDTENEIGNKIENRNESESRIITGSGNAGERENESSQVSEVTNNEQEKDAAVLTQEIYSLNSTIGTLYIPKTKLTTSVYSSAVVSQMEKMPCFLYTTGGLNNNGITLIVGHNRRNGKMFSNNKNLVQGDEFYFTNLAGRKLKYIIYSKFITKEDDTSFLNNDVQVPTIALSCCTDASDDNRIIILGKAE